LTFYQIHGLAQCSWKALPGSATLSRRNGYRKQRFQVHFLHSWSAKMARARRLGKSH